MQEALSISGAVMSDIEAAAKLEQGSHLPGDEDRDFKSFADEGYDPGKVVPGGYDLEGSGMREVATSLARTVRKEG
jgi:hypothetical protein